MDEELIFCIAKYIDPVLDVLEEVAIENIEKLDIDASGELKESIIGTWDGQNAILGFEFADHGIVQDQGLSGTVGGSTPFKPTLTGSIRQNESSRTFTPGTNDFKADAQNIFIAYADIRRWIQDRGVPFFAGDLDSTAVLLRGTIAERGYVGRPWIQPTLDDPRIEAAMEVAVDRATQECVDNLLDDFEDAII